MGMNQTDHKEDIIENPQLIIPPQNLKIQRSINYGGRGSIKRKQEMDDLLLFAAKKSANEVKSQKLIKGSNKWEEAKGRFKRVFKESEIPSGNLEI